MPAQLLRRDTRLTPVNVGVLPTLQPAVATACHNKHSSFFRVANRVITFDVGKVNYRIDVGRASDNRARQQMNLGTDDGMLYAQLQTGSGQTIANIVYPEDDTKVQLTTLITALQQSMANRSVYTAIL